MSAVRSEVMDRLPDWQLILQLQIREIEKRHARIHADLLDWGYWGRGWNPDRPTLAPSGVWSLPGEHDPDLDPEAIPESPPPPVNERRILELDRIIGDLQNFPAVWRKILAVNYVGARVRAGYYIVLPEWQRPGAAKVGPENYRLQLARSLKFLEAPLDNAKLLNHNI